MRMIFDNQYIGLTASHEKISYKGFRFFNGLPNETKQETNFKILKGKCEEFVREKIKKRK
jgi:hypothetical protein